MSFVMHPWSLSFVDAEVERAWCADYAAEHARQVRGAVLGLILVFSAFVVNDWFVFRSVFTAFTVLRFGVTVPLLVAGWVWQGTAAGRRALTTHLQEYLGALALLACGTMLGMTALVAPTATVEQAWFSVPSFALALLCVYGLARLRFTYAVAIGSLTSVTAMAMLHRLGPPEPRVVELLPFVVAFNVTGAWVTRTLELLGRREFVERRELVAARARSEALLHNVLPVEIAARLRDGGERGTLASSHTEVTVVLADVVGFTPMCERLPLEELAPLLDELHVRFDQLAEAHGIEKIKTLGDAWLAAAGVPRPRLDHADVAARFALALVALGEDRGLRLRLGLGSGPAVAGVIGKTRFAYDLWGPAVRAAQAMERGGRPGWVRVDAALAERLAPRWEVLHDADGAWLVGERPAARASA